MLKKCFSLIGLLILFSISPVIAETHKSRLELDFGTSYKLQKYNQILNPEAEQNLETVQGLDGHAAQAVINQYRKSFQEPEKSPVYELKIGGENSD